MSERYVYRPENPCVHAPSFERNRDVVLDVLRHVLPQRGLVLEIGSGTGQHVAWFARSLRGQDPEWGVRDIADVAAAAADRGLRLTERIPTPHNNFSLVLRRAGEPRV